MCSRYATRSAPEGRKHRCRLLAVGVLSLGVGAAIALVGVVAYRDSVRLPMIWLPTIEEVRERLRRPLPSDVVALRNDLAWLALFARYRPNSIESDLAFAELQAAVAERCRRAAATGDPAVLRAALELIDAWRLRARRDAAVVLIMCLDRELDSYESILIDRFCYMFLDGVGLDRSLVSQVAWWGRHAPSQADRPSWEPYLRSSGEFGMPQTVPLPKNLNGASWRLAVRSLCVLRMAGPGVLTETDVYRLVSDENPFIQRAGWLFALGHPASVRILHRALELANSSDASLATVAAAMAVRDLVRYAGERQDVVRAMVIEWIDHRVSIQQKHEGLELVGCLLAGIVGERDTTELNGLPSAWLRAVEEYGGARRSWYRDGGRVHPRGG